MRASLKTLVPVLLLAAAGPAQAVSGSVVAPHGAPPAVAMQNDGMTLNQAVEQVRRQYGGRIVSAETRRDGKREVHHIKVLTADGKVKTVKVPGRRH
ncbi:MAG: hypothetical protein BMS9Abin32_491 [Gammaproteobacteria bacterium]|nr:MAG: hypothetical protein BMS9Abin32_491 [Gammaproteobacteria bacterium]